MPIATDLRGIETWEGVKRQTINRQQRVILKQNLFVDGAMRRTRILVFQPEKYLKKLMRFEKFQILKDEVVITTKRFV